MPRSLSVTVAGVAVFGASLLACGTGGPIGVTGSACQLNTDCAGGLCAPLDDGYCTTDCGDAACAPGERCRAAGGHLYCMAACAAPADCRAGYQCFRGACVPACASDGDCARGYGCAAGQCSPLPGDATGAPCTADDTCSSRYCEPATATCRVPCASEDECDPGQTCFVNPVASEPGGRIDAIRPICIPVREGTVAVGEACKGDGDCHLGSCQLGRCSTLCSGPSGCPTSTACVAMYAATADGLPQPVKGCLPASGTLSFALPDSSSGPLGVPASAVSFGLYTEAMDQDLGYYAGVSNVSDPMDSLYDLNTDFYSNRLRYQPSEGASFVLVSTSPLAVLVPGAIYTYQAFAQTASGKTTDFTVRGFVKLAPGGAVSSGTVSLHVFVSNLAGGCKTFTAATAPSVLAPWEKRMREIYAAAHITIDAITYADVTVASTLTQTDTKTQPGLDNVLKAATANDTPGALELTILKHINASASQQGFEILGIAGGIPGSPGIPGTPHSGAVVSLSSLCADKTQNEFALTAAHELGHTLGLYHNVEQDGHQDLMTDDDANPTSNLMYWAENGGLVQAQISAQQAAALLKNPVVRP